MPGLVDYRAAFDGCLRLDLRLTPEGSENAILGAAHRLYPGCTLVLHSQPAQLEDRPLYLGKRHVEYG